MDQAIDAAEPITRYLRNRSHLRLGKGCPHFSAYMPRFPDGNISVYRTTGMASAEVVALGAKFVGSPDALLKGHCDLDAASFFDEGLNIEAAPSPHARHANVSGWTNDPKNRIIARKLADQARLTTY